MNQRLSGEMSSPLIVHVNRSVPQFATDGDAPDRSMTAARTRLAPSTILKLPDMTSHLSSAETSSSATYGAKSRPSMTGRLKLLSTSPVTESTATSRSRLTPFTKRNRPPTINDPFDRAMSRTSAFASATNVGSTEPSAIESFASRSLDSPFTVVKSPPMNTEEPSGEIARPSTSPFNTGAKSESISPVETLNLKIDACGMCGLSEAALRMVANVPPTMTVSPYDTIACTVPSMILGWSHIGKSSTTTSCVASADPAPRSIPRMRAHATPRATMPTRERILHAIPTPMPDPPGSP